MSHVATVLDQSNFGALREAGDRFGAALDAGRLGTDAYDDLVIGAPGENSGAGAIFISSGTNIWMGNLPAAPSKFLRIRGILP